MKLRPSIVAALLLGGGIVALVWAPSSDTGESPADAGGPGSPASGRPSEARGTDGGDPAFRRLAAELAVTADVPLEVSTRCAIPEPCGGDPVGRWRLVAQCKTRAPTPWFEIACPEAEVTAQDTREGGVIDIWPDGRQRMLWLNEATLRISIPNTCLAAPGGCRPFDGLTRAHPGLRCVADATGCRCTGRVTWGELDTRRWRVEGPILLAAADFETEQNDLFRIPFCRQGDRLTMVTDDDSPDNPFGRKEFRREPLP